MTRPRPKKNNREVRYQSLQINWKLLFKMLFIFVTCGIIVNQCESNTTLKLENEILQYELLEKDSIIHTLTPKPVIEKKIDSIKVESIQVKRIPKPIVVDTIIPVEIIHDTL